MYICHCHALAPVRMEQGNSPTEKALFVKESYTNLPSPSLNHHDWCTYRCVSDYRGTKVSILASKGIYCKWSLQKRHFWYKLPTKIGLFRHKILMKRLGFCSLAPFYTIVVLCGALPKQHAYRANTLLLLLPRYMPRAATIHVAHLHKSTCSPTVCTRSHYAMFSIFTLSLSHTHMHTYSLSHFSLLSTHKHVFLSVLLANPFSLHI